MMPANSRFISATERSDRGPWKSKTMVMPSPWAEGTASHANAQIQRRRIVEATELRLELYQLAASAQPPVPHDEDTGEFRFPSRIGGGHVLARIGLYRAGAGNIRRDADRLH